MLNSFIKNFNQNGEVYLRIKARPGAAKTGVKEIMADQTIKIDLAAAPVKGKANQELIKFLARRFDTAAGNVKIISGAGDRVKLVKLVR
ncbi:MAG: DUF167 domain-containing protein [Parcubacteria group bacterium]|nr:DUF167 domain-containing protein [Parcubacteria group bacterium]